MANPRQTELLIQASQVGADVTYMPLLVDRSIFGANNLDGQRAELFSPTGSNAARSDGGDLRWYINSDQTSELASDLVSFSLDAVTGSNVAEVDQGEMQAWIGGSGQLISSVTNTPVFLEYGDSALTQYANGDPYGRNNVYDANYVGVYHMEEDPSSTAPQIIDSSGNGNHGTTSGAMTSSDSVPGKIGNSLEFDGANDDVNLGAMNPGAGLSVQSWVNIPPDNTIRQILSRDNSSNSRVWQFRIGAANELRFVVFSTTGSSGVSSAAAISGSHVKIDGTWSGTTIRTYINGAADGVAAFSGTPVTSAPGSAFFAKAETSSPGRLLGNIGESRISNIARAASFWLTTEYNNQNSPSTFWSVNLPNAIGVAPPVTLLQMTIGINKMNGGFA